jgi:hypothetical protein
VSFDGATGKVEPAGDLGVGLSLGDKFSDAGFGPGEAVPASGRALARGVGVGAHAVGAELCAGAVQVPSGAKVLV